MSYKIVDDAWKEIEGLDKNKIVLVTDENIYRLYEKSFRGYEDRLIVIRSGEENKNIISLQYIYERLIELNVTRDMTIVSIGGGVVGDISGFASGTFKRGIDYIQIPTTLLSQVDSSVGGKTGIDFLGFKNIIGCFNFPKSSLIDPNFLGTLSKRDILCGYGEILKYGLIDDYDFFEYSILNREKIFSLDKDVILTVVGKSVESKEKIVEIDNLDKGIRRNLNFGHTIGHGIESYYKYEKYSHGEGVIIGMIIEAYISFKRGNIGGDYYRDIYDNLINLVAYEEISDINLLLSFIRADKKNEDGKINMVLPIARGKVDVFSVKEEEIVDGILNFRGEVIV